ETLLRELWYTRVYCLYRKENERDRCGAFCPIARTGRIGFFQYQTTKVRVLFIEEEGLIVLNRSKNHRLGIIPYCFLNTKNEEIREGRSLYVQYMGESMDGFLLFAEEEAVQTPADYERYYKEWLKKHL